MDACKAVWTLYQPPVQGDDKDNASQQAMLHSQSANKRLAFPIRRVDLGKAAWAGSWMNSCCPSIPKAPARPCSGGLERLQRLLSQLWAGGNRCWVTCQSVSASPLPGNCVCTRACVCVPVHVCQLSKVPPLATLADSLMFSDVGFPDRWLCHPCLERAPAAVPDRPTQAALHEDSSASLPLRHRSGLIPWPAPSLRCTLKGQYRCEGVESRLGSSVPSS